MSAPPWALVRAAQGAAKADGYDLWAAARLSALGFYRRLGLHPTGDESTEAIHLPHRRVLWRRPVDRSRPLHRCRGPGSGRVDEPAMSVSRVNDKAAQAVTNAPWNP